MSVWAGDENSDNLKHNKKLRFIGNATQIGSIPTTAEGQMAFSTVGSVTFPINKIVSRLAGNTGWSGVLTEAAEDSFDMPVPATDGQPGTIFKYFRPFTLPSTEEFYLITKIEWKNGATISGNITTGVSLLNANPPTLDGTPLIAVGQTVAQSGANSLQSTTVIRGKPIRSGSHIAATLHCSSATADIKTDTAGEQYYKTISYTASPPTADNAAFAVYGAEWWITLYYVGYS